MGWAAAVQLPSVTAMTLLEQSAEAIRLGRSILAAAELPVLRDATWRNWRLPDGDGPPDRDGGLAADLATASYVLGELTQPQQAAMVDLAVRAAPAVVLVEPGTPAGHRRILAARGQLLGAGYLLAAPCPHELGCPLQTEGDWCHFGARLPRSGLHRKVKGAELGYEDEKFSYVAAVRPGLLGEPDLPAGRIVRRPQQRKGLVTLELCQRDGSAGRELIGKSAGETYRQARKATWGTAGHSQPQGCRSSGHADPTTRKRSARVPVLRHLAAVTCARNTHTSLGRLPLAGGLPWRAAGEAQGKLAVWKRSLGKGLELFLAPGEGAGAQVGDDAVDPGQFRGEHHAPVLVVHPYGPRQAGHARQAGVHGGKLDAQLLGALRQDFGGLGRRQQHHE